MIVIGKNTTSLGSASTFLWDQCLLIWRTVRIMLNSAELGNIHHKCDEIQSAKVNNVILTNIRVSVVLSKSLCRREMEKMISNLDSAV